MEYSEILNQFGRITEVNGKYRAEVIVPDCYTGALIVENVARTNYKTLKGAENAVVKHMTTYHADRTDPTYWD